MEKVVVCVSLEEELMNQLDKLKGSEILRGKKVIFAHCFEVQLYAYDFMASYYPSEEQIPDIEQSVTGLLNNVADKVLEADDRGNAEMKFLHSTDPKGQLIKFLEESGASKVVVATRGKHGVPGLFSSSFAEHMVRYSPCDLVILRPNN